MSENKCASDVWDNHFAAFAAADVDKCMIDYTEASVIHFFDQAKEVEEGVNPRKYTGLEEVKQFFVGVFAKLDGKRDDLAAPVILSSDTPRHTFLAWRAPMAGFLDATDTFIYDDNLKIAAQTVVVRTK